MWQSIKWNVPLGARPILLQIDAAVHGQLPVETFHLDGIWCLHLYMDPAEVIINGHHFPIQPGYVGLTPPNVNIEYRYGKERWENLHAHFVLPPSSDENIQICAMQDFGPDFGVLHSCIENAAHCFQAQPRRAEIKLWDILYGLAERSSDPVSHSTLSPAVQQTVQQIEASIGQPISVAALVQESGYSYSHLTRLFHSQLGLSITAYIQKRRIERAHHLLRHSDVPIKAVASLVGIPDLHFFNKIVRRYLGRSPRQVREADALLRSPHG